MGYMHHQRCEIDRRSVRVRLTPQKGREVRDNRWPKLLRAPRRRVAKPYRPASNSTRLSDINEASLHRVERFWGDQIRYIY